LKTYNSSELLNAKKFFETRKSKGRLQWLTEMLQQLRHIDCYVVTAAQEDAVWGALVAVKLDRYFVSVTGGVRDKANFIAEHFGKERVSAAIFADDDNENIATVQERCTWVQTVAVTEKRGLTREHRDFILQWADGLAKDYRHLYVARRRIEAGSSLEFASISRDQHIVFAAMDSDKDLYYNIGDRNGRYRLTAATGWRLLNFNENYDELIKAVPDISKAMWRERGHGASTQCVWKRSSNKDIDYDVYKQLCVYMEKDPLYMNYDGIITELPHFSPPVEVVLFRRCAKHTTINECTSRPNSAGLVWTPAKRSRCDAADDVAAVAGGGGGGGGGGSAPKKQNTSNVI
jgi:hypothetical protein